MRFSIICYFIFVSVGNAFRTNVALRTQLRLRNSAFHAMSMESIDPNSTQKRALKSSIKSVTTTMTRASKEGKETAITWAILAVINSKAAAIKLFENIKTLFARVKIVCLEAVASIMRGEVPRNKALRSAAAAYLPVSSTSRKSPRITTSLLPIEDAKLAVQKTIKEIAAAEERALALNSKTPVPSSVEYSSAASATLPSSSSTSASVASAKAAAPFPPVSILGSSSTMPQTSSAVSPLRMTTGDNSTDPPPSEKKQDSPIQKMKALGQNGVIAYAITELAFWLIAIPCAFIAYHTEEGSWLSLTDEADRVKILAFTATFVTGARFLVPLRLSLAVGLVPFIEKFRNSEGGSSSEASGAEKRDDAM